MIRDEDGYYYSPSAYRSKMDDECTYYIKEDLWLMIDDYTAVSINNKLLVNKLAWESIGWEEYDSINKGRPYYTGPYEGSHYEYLGASSFSDGESNTNKILKTSLSYSFILDKDSKNVGKVRPAFDTVLGCMYKSYTPGPLYIPSVSEMANLVSLVVDKSSPTSKMLHETFGMTDESDCPLIIFGNTYLDKFNYLTSTEAVLDKDKEICNKYYSVGYYKKENRISIDRINKNIGSVVVVFAKVR